MLRRVAIPPAVLGLSLLIAACPHDRSPTEPPGDPGGSPGPTPGPTPEPTPTGSLRLNVVTSGQDGDPDGYLVTVPGVGSWRVAAGGSTVIDRVPGGAANVVITDVASNCALFGPAQREATIATGQTSDLRVAVICVAHNAYNFGGIDLSMFNFNTLGYTRGAPTSQSSAAGATQSRNFYKGFALSYSLGALNRTSWSGTSRASYGELDGPTRRDMLNGYGVQTAYGYEDYRIFRSVARGGGAPRLALSAASEAPAVVLGYDTTLALRFAASRYADHSRRVVFYLDSTYRDSTGYVAVDAPLWGGGDGVFPTVMRTVLDVTTGGVRTWGYIGSLLLDDTGQNGRQVMIMQSSTGETRWYDVTMQDGALAGVVRAQNATGVVELSVIQNSAGYATTVRTSTGESGTLIVGPDGAGYYELPYLGVPFFYALWNAQGSGYYQSSGGARVPFADVRTLFGG